MNSVELKNIQRQAKDLVSEDFADAGLEYLEVLQTLIMARATEKVGIVIAESLDEIAKQIDLSRP